MNTVSMSMAFLAGLASFFSPCVLPLVPVYFGVLGGTSLTELFENPGRARLLPRAIAFVAGFSVIFITLGMSASLLGNILLSYRRYLEIGAGLLAILFGLHFSGIIQIPLLNRQYHVKRSTPGAGAGAGTEGGVGAGVGTGANAAAKKPRTGIWPSFLLGMAFSVGWTPCVGPALGTILGMAGTTGTALSGFWLLICYSLGLGVPFLLAAAFIRYLFPKWSKIARYARIAQIIGGFLMIIAGLLLITGYFTRLSGILGG